MDKAIISVCQALKEESEAVISYSEKIAALGSDEATSGTVQALEKIRLDEIEHIQTLTLQLTSLAVGGGNTEPPAEAPDNE